MNNDLKIAIVIPVFNGEKFLKDSIESAINQNYENKIVILCNDGSSDESNLIIEEYALNKIVLIINNDLNLGLSKSLEKALLMALDSNCVIATIIGQDDILPRDYISKTIPQFNNSKIQLLYSELKIIDRFGALTGERIFPPDLAIYGRYSTKLLLKDNFITAPGALFRLYPENTFFKAFRCDLVQDYSQWLYLSTKGKLKMSVKSYVYYRKHDKNLSNHINSKQLRQEKNIIKLDFYQKNKKDFLNQLTTNFSNS